MRSPFVRLRELLGDIPPGKSAISLAVGEPQHGVPSFVGPVLAASLDEFGKYPMNKGLDEFCAAAAAWLGRRFSLPRPVDPATEVLILNGSREGLFLAGIAAERWANGRSGRPAILMPNPFYGAYEAGAVAAHADAVYPAGDRRDRLPARPRFAHRRAAVAHRRLLSGLAGQPAGLGREPGLFRATRRSLRASTGSSCSATNAIPRSTRQRRRPACWSTAGRDFENVVVFQSLSKRSNLPGLRVGFVAGDRRVPRPLPRTAQRLVAASAGAGAARRHRRLWR